MQYKNAHRISAHAYAFVPRGSKSVSGKLAAHYDYWIDCTRERRSKEVIKFRGGLLPVKRLNSSSCTQPMKRRRQETGWVDKREIEQYLTTLWRLNWNVYCWKRSSIGCDSKRSAGGVNRVPEYNLRAHLNHTIVQNWWFCSNFNGNENL